MVELKETINDENDENKEDEKLLTEEEIFDETVLEVATEEIPLREEEPVRAPLCGCFNRSYAKLGNPNKPSIWSLFKVRKIKERCLKNKRKKMLLQLLFFMVYFPLFLSYWKRFLLYG